MAQQKAPPPNFMAQPQKTLHNDKVKVSDDLVLILEWVQEMLEYLDVKYLPWWEIKYQSPSSKRAFAIIVNFEMRGTPDDKKKMITCLESYEDPTQICEVKHHEVQDEQRDLIVNEIPVGKNDFPEVTPQETKEQSWNDGSTATGTSYGMGAF